MKAITVDTVQEVIRLAKLAYPETTEAKIIHGKDTTWNDVFESSSATEVALNTYVSLLSQEALAELAALMYLGSERGSAEQWDSYLSNAREMFRPDHVSYTHITEKTPLARYLILGLEAIGKTE